jgi:hypothetical protein
MIQLESDVKASDIRRLVANLEQIERKQVFAFKRELKEPAGKIAKDIVNSIDKLTPLSGMMSQTAGALQWNGAKATVSYSISYSRRYAVTPLIAIKVDSPTGYPGYYVTEKAGKRNPQGLTPRGRTMIDRINWKFGYLKGRGGNRIAWKYFAEHRDDLNRQAKEIIEKFEKKVETELNR